MTSLLPTESLTHASLPHMSLSRSRHAARGVCRHGTSWQAVLWARHLCAQGGSGSGSGSSAEPSGPRVLDVLSSARRRQRADALNSDLRRGYFDDFKDAAQKRVSPPHLVPGAQAVPLPAVPLVDAWGASTGVAAPGFACVVFRSGAARALASWAPTLLACMSSEPSLTFTQVSVIEPWLYSLPGLRTMLLRSGRTPPLHGGGARGQHHAFLFGAQHSDLLRRQLGLSNRLCAHILLIDAKARVRWKAAGEADATELQSLPQLVADMLRDRS